MNQVDGAPAQGFSALRWIGTIIFLILGVPLIWGGIRLVGLGGSPYYVIAGLLLAVTAILILRHTLSDIGDFRFAKSGEDALQLARQFNPHLMLLDAHMPFLEHDHHES